MAAEEMLLIIWTVVGMNASSCTDQQSIWKMLPSGILRLFYDLIFSSFSKPNFERIRQKIFHCPQVAETIAYYLFCIIIDNTADYDQLFVSSNCV